MVQYSTVFLLVECQHKKMLSSSYKFGLPQEFDKILFYANETVKFDTNIIMSKTTT